jgi:hypothetical protein
MLLVPRQLQRVGMTGHVPYYGGRLMPAQAYAASHPKAAPPPPPPARRVADPAASVEALVRLKDTGVITPQEYEQLVARVTG